MTQDFAAAVIDNEAFHFIAKVCALRLLDFAGRRNAWIRGINLYPAFFREDFRCGGDNILHLACSIKESSSAKMDQDSVFGKQKIELLAAKAELFTSKRGLTFEVVCGDQPFPF
jgi:hypothetical protein